MKSNHLIKTTLSLAIVLLANLSTYAQTCIYSTSYDISEIYNNGDGTCDYEIDLCAAIQGSPRPKRIIYTVIFDKSGDGTNDSELTYEFNSPENHIPDGNYCLASMPGDESFVISIPCGGEVSVSIIGYKSGSGSNGGSCVGFDENISTASLPVELVNFNTSLFDEQVLLEWTTASEIDHDYFAIERSINSKDFEKIGQLNNSEDSYELKHYSFTDDSPATGNNFYRLRQVDLNGHATLSDIRVVNISHIKDYLIYPSLATEKVTVNFGKQLESRLSIRVIDMNGKLVKETQASRGQEEIVIETIDLAYGAYLVTFAGEFDRTVIKPRRFMKIG